MSFEDLDKLGARIEQSLVALLEALREIQWELILLSVALDEGGGPMFDEPEELRRYIRAI